MLEDYRLPYVLPFMLPKLQEPKPPRMTMTRLLAASPTSRAGLTPSPTCPPGKVVPKRGCGRDGN